MAPEAFRRGADDDDAELLEPRPGGGAATAAWVSALALRMMSGGVFAGDFAPVAVGDYGVGPNHVLPTGGAARFSSPLSVRDFERRQTVVRMTRRDLARLAPDVVTVARAEGFPGHAQSVETRFAADRGTARRDARARRPA